MGLLAMAALASPAWSQLVLAEPTSAVYYSHALVAGQELQVEKDTAVEGNLHSNGTLVLKKGSQVTGDVSAAGTIDASGTVTGNVTPGADPLALPALLSEAEMRALADRVFEEDTILADVVIDDVVFVDGTLQIRGDINGTGTLLATGDIRIDTTGKMGQGGGGGGGDEGGFHLDPSTRLSLIALNDIRIAKDRPFRGVLRAGHDISLESANTFEGVAIADNLLQVKKDSTVTFLALDEDPPTIELLAPADGSVVDTATPEIVVSLDDSFSGLDLESLSLTLDGVEVSGDATLETQPDGSTLVRFTPSTPLPDGLHALDVAVSDNAGNTASASFSFTTTTAPPPDDVTPPVVSVDAPTGVLVDELQPQVVVSYSDSEAGVDLATLVVDINGGAITSSCTVGPSSAVCAPVAPLAAQIHTVNARIDDRSGNTGSASGSFELIIETPPEEPPTVNLVSPNDGSVTNSPAVAAAGSVLGPDVTVEVDGFPAVIDGEVFTTNVPLVEGVNTVTAIATNAFGTATSSVVVTLDTVDPEVVITSPADGELTRDAATVVTGTVSDASEITEVDLDGVPLTLDANGAFSLAVDLEFGLNELTLSAFDLAGNFVTQSFTVERGEVPQVSIVEPLSGALLRTGEVEVIGAFTSFFDDETSVNINELQIDVTVDGVVAEVNADNTFRAVVPILPGSNLITATATNRFGTTSATTTVERRVRPEVEITSPAGFALLGDAQVEVTGTVSDANVAVQVAGQPAVVTAGTPSTFSAFLTLVEGANTLDAVATAPDGEVDTDTVLVTLDTQPPTVTVTSPAPGAEVRDATVTVAGTFHDLAVTSGGSPPQVVVNGVDAELTNGAFLATGVSLPLGASTLSVTATDRAGNLATAEVPVVRTAAALDGLHEISGDLQTGTVSTVLGAPLVAELRDATGQGIPGAEVFFRVVENSGVLTGGGHTGRTVAVVTDGQGRASATWTLGSRAGMGNQLVEASVVGDPRKLFYRASGEAGGPAQVFLDGGQAQRGLVAETLPRPLTVIVTDAENNRLAGAPVVFEVSGGDGELAGGPDGETARTVLADATGTAQVFWTLGASPGINRHQVTAFLQDVEGAAVNFQATALLPGDPADTRISGTVLDPAGAPIEGVAIELLGTGLTAQTDAEGAFLLTGVPIGAQHLEADGSTSSRPGTWPTLEYELDVIPGHENTVGQPIRLLPLDTENGIFVDETTGGTLTLPELPGLSLEVEPGSATFPDGSTSGLVSLTAVNAEQVPMTPNFGQQPRLIVTIQPTGVTFDPPARFTLPNVDALRPGKVTELYSFDHDQFRFVSIGTGIVSEDGLTITSAPGTGIVEGGWHCGSDPAPSGDCCDCDEPCKKCENGRCVNNDGARPPEPECQTRSKGAEFQKASNLAKAALEKLPWVDNPMFSGSVSATTCPICCGGGTLMPGTKSVGGSVTAMATVEVVLSPYKAKLDKKTTIFGREVRLKADVGVGPKVAADLTLTVGVSGSRNYCNGGGCVTFEGCGGGVFRAGGQAKFEVLVQVGDWIAEFELGAEIFGQTTAVGKVKYEVGEGCTEPGTVTEGCTGDFDLNLVVTGFGLTETYTYTVFEGTKPCSC